MLFHDGGAVFVSDLHRTDIMMDLDPYTVCALPHRVFFCTLSVERDKWSSFNMMIGAAVYRISF